MPHWRPPARRQRRAAPEKSTSRLGGQNRGAQKSAIALLTNVSPDRERTHADVFLLVERAQRAEDLLPDDELDVLDQPAQRLAHRANLERARDLVVRREEHRLVAQLDHRVGDALQHLVQAERRLHRAQRVLQRLNAAVGARGGVELRLGLAVQARFESPGGVMATV
jgi:hypothetical protein